MNLQIRKDFRIDNRIIYFDNAATTFKPNIVINVVKDSLSRLIKDEEIMKAKKSISNFLGIKYSENLHFVKGATRAINLVATNLNIEEDDEVLISGMEHHSNIIPWQVICREKKAKLKIIPIDFSGEILYEEYLKLLSKKTKIVSIVQASNSLGTINDVKRIVYEAKKLNALVLVDGSQSVGHTKTDIEDLGCDFFTFSGHKVYGPTGIGVLYIKNNLFVPEIYDNKPYILGLSSALEYISSDFNNFISYEKELAEYTIENLKNLNINVIGAAKNKVPVISFDIKGIHPHDISTILNSNNICVRAGHHCTQPVMSFFDIPATTRVSFSFYNTYKEVDIFLKTLKKMMEFFK